MLFSSCMPTVSQPCVQVQTVQLPPSRLAYLVKQRMRACKHLKRVSPDIDLLPAVWTAARDLLATDYIPKQPPKAT